MIFTEFLRSILSYTSYVLVFYCLALSGYRLALHPLRHYPGPFLAKITQAYAGFYAAKKRLHIEVYQYHQRYGKGSFVRVPAETMSAYRAATGLVVRVGPNRLVFNTATALKGEFKTPNLDVRHGLSVKDIYQNDRVTKASTYLVTTRNNVFNVFTAIDNTVHSKKRKIVGQAVSDRSLRAFEPTILEKLDITLKQIWRASQASSAVDVTEMSRYLALDVVGQLSFGYDLDIQTKEDNRFMMKGMTFGNYRGNVYQHFPLLSELYIDKIGDKVFYEAREKYFRLLEKMITSRTAEDKDAKHDFYSFVADSFKNTTRGGDLWLEAIFFLVAGGDTAATAMCGVFFYLSRYPEAYKKLAGEIRGNFATASDIKTGPQLSSYGHVIPTGVIVGVNIYALHHNEEYFSDPFVYKPERWIDTSQKEGKDGSKLAYNAAFAPFSVGPRACAGKSLAYMETSLLIAKVLWYFDFEAAPGKLGEIGGGRAGQTNGRGHLSSTTFETEADDVRALLDRLDIKKLHAWIGVSFGGATAITFAAKYPGIIEKLIPCGVVACSPINAGKHDIFGQRVAKARAAGDLDSTIAQTMDRWFDHRLQSNPSRWDSVKKSMQTTSLDGFETCISALRHPNFDLRRIAAKAGRGIGSALLLVGKEDDLHEQMEVLRKGIEMGQRVKSLRSGKGEAPCVGLHIVGDGGHVLFVDGWYHFTEIICRFINA
ncbi:hypothetical protein NUW58_g3714 [Xylaria curta]|uniref:Uncharacterized protein n=1 Tax=Xylaria curta TaxID=42375 RepID=A0ACC1PA77_9PEZI|nr:hypothetical protein NUW58_g3714 [Xylaria curta]